MKSDILFLYGARCSFLPGDRPGGELARAMPLSHFFIRALTGGRSPGTAEDRAALIAEAKPLLVSMAPGAMRLQLLRELADAARTPVESLEALFGLRRRTARPAPMERRTPHVEVADLKRRILQQLLVHPQLAREFDQSVADEHLDGEERVDKEIVEVWRTASDSASSAAALSHGALLEILVESEFAGEYRALAAQEMELETEIETARQVVEEAFQKLRLRRFERVRSERLAEYQQDPCPERLDAYRLADQAYLRARSAGSEPSHA